ncbi:flagellar hook-basal body protein [Arcobacter lacus]|uniref:flagellar hook-basal body protein n=1 Tax=Arcobacter lacus TaxID=1912876 RepID=UPI0021BB0399|nr:flagellar hook-basal body protein [Arcobacter lacus]MCT7911863.1 flagellar hook-basal body protein [Arcobacter lacus]
MNQGVYPLAASMINQINRLDQISNNLANVNTLGFKQEGTTETTFNYYLQKMENEQKVMLKESVVTNNIPKIDSRYTNAEMGPIVMTGNKLDFALNEPDTFFKIQNDNGDIVYTRDGAFKNLDGFLVDSNGNNVLNADNEAIVVEDGFELQIGVAKTPYTNLEKLGDNTYLAKNEDEIENFENNDNRILRGAVEQSNVNSVTAMVELIDAHRRFDQSQRAVKTIDELNASLIEKVGGNTK